MHITSMHLRFLIYKIEIIIPALLTSQGCVWRLDERRGVCCLYLVSDSLFWGHAVVSFLWAFVLVTPSAWSALSPSLFEWVHHSEPGKRLVLWEAALITPPEMVSSSPVSYIRCSRHSQTPVMASLLTWLPVAALSP